MSNIIPQQRTRAIILFLYIGILFFANYLAFGKLIPLYGAKGLWFFSGFASILLGNLLITPLYIKPVDAVSYSVVAGIALYLVNDWTSWLLIEQILFIISVSFVLIVLISAFISIFSKDSPNQAIQNISNTCRILSGLLGNQRFIFSIVILFALIIFHRENPREFFYITLAWVITVLIKPDLILYTIWFQIKKIWSKRTPINVIGVVAAYQTPDIVLIRQSSTQDIEFGTTIMINDPFAPPRLGVALDYVGRDEALLLRCLGFQIPFQKRDILSEYTKLIPSNTVGKIKIDDIISNEKFEVKILEDLSNFVGLVAAETSLDTLYFEVIHEIDLEEGRLIEVYIKNEPVLFQIIDGLIKEEIVYKKNTFGFVRVKAKKIGVWDLDNKRFTPAKWFPKLNSPVYLKTTSKYEPTLNSVGRFPATNYSVSIENINDLVTHNTAILGILGIGKSMLAIELIERMITKKIKVICLDLTNQYAQELSDFYNTDIESKRIKKIQDAGQKDMDEWKQNPEEGGSLPNLTEAIFNDLSDFLKPGNRELIKIYNPSQLFATKQLNDPRNFKVGSNWETRAALWKVTPVEITKIITECTLEISQDKMTDKARVCLIFEEAHSLIPEWGTVSSDGDKSATNATARAILQGRKYGLGCILITQRTANVTKTILNQCNTIFALRIFDDTGKEFLSNYIGRDYATILSTIFERHAVFFGKASSCENPVLIRLNDQDKFREIFRLEHPPPDLRTIYSEKDQTHTSTNEISEESIDIDDDLPF
ncbi:MAG: DUF87 domain-containing protein [Ignavibacteria bacterium]|nr:DUF87 domain-containing protein [Ignavibacteria bacterium]